MSYVEEPPAAPRTGRGSGPRAGFWRRFAAVFVDGVILAVISFILEAVLHSVGSILALLVGLAYFSLLEGGPRGQTIGKSALGIRVISLADGAPIGYPRGAIRWIGRIVSEIVIFLGYLWMLWDRESQCWHDKFAGSIVVPVSAYPLPPK